MTFEHKTTLFLGGLLLSLLPLIFSKMNTHIEGKNEIGGNIAALNDDEISYALSELSVDDLNALSKLIDVLGEEVAMKDENDLNSQEISALKRFKRENSDTSAVQDTNNLLPNVNEEYIKQLEDSFPNIIDQPNQEKNHIRVKRD